MVTFTYIFGWNPAVNSQKWCIKNTIKYLQLDIFVN